MVRLLHLFVYSRDLLFAIHYNFDLHNHIRSPVVLKGLTLFFLGVVLTFAGLSMRSLNSAFYPSEDRTADGCVRMISDRQMGTIRFMTGMSLTIIGSAIDIADT